MKTLKPLVLLLIILLQLTVSAQVQWYQNQDGNNPPPYGTVATSVQGLTKSSFVAAYLWTISNDQNTWKISKTHVNGTEQRSFFITAVSATVEFKVGRKNSLYVFERSFTPEFLPQYFVYKLDTNFNVVQQRSIQFPNEFSIFNVNAFELDDEDNVYFAGDGQYPQDGSLYPASFVLKTNKHLATQWSKMDSVETSYTRLHINKLGFVGVISDHYTTYPNIGIRIFTPNGHFSYATTIKADPARYSLYSKLDNNEDLILYGGKMADDTTQAIYISKISRWTGRVIYCKTLFKSPSTSLLDLKIDLSNNIFSVVQQFFYDGSQFSKVSRINSGTGGITWTKSMRYSIDSVNLFKVITDQSDRIYVIGERRTNNIFSKGYSLRIKKNGDNDGVYASPDSVAFQRSHWLSDGVTDQDQQLIAIGSTQDIDTTTGGNTYFRSFAIRFGRKNECGDDRAQAMESASSLVTDEVVGAQVKMYPNPATDQVSISNINPEVYNRLALYNLQGRKVTEQSITGSAARIDLTKFTDGVYIAVLRSSSTGKEESFKFIVKR